MSYATRAKAHHETVRIMTEQLREAGYRLINTVGGPNGSLLRFWTGGKHAVVITQEWADSHDGVALYVLASPDEIYGKGK